MPSKKGKIITLINLESVSKICSFCGKRKMKLHFNWGLKGIRLSSWCRDCSKLAKKEWNIKNKEYVYKTNKEFRENFPEKMKKSKLEWIKNNPEKNFMGYKKRSLKKHYGITLQDYESILVSQSGKCAICGVEKNTFKGKWNHAYFSIDHEHGTKNVRGLLCSSCNVGLGHFKDDENILMQAARYLIKAKEKRGVA